MTLTFRRLSSAFCWLGRQLVVGDEQVEAGLALRLGELLGLALADVPVRVDVAAVLPLGADDVGAGGRREVGELGQRFLGGPAGIVAGVDREEERLLDGRREIDRVGVGRGSGHGRRIARGRPAAIMGAGLRRSLIGRLRGAAPARDPHSAIDISHEGYSV